MGRFYEFYQARDAGITALLQLTPLARNRRGARFGFPVDRFNYYLEELLQQHLPVTVIRQSGRRWTGIEERLAVC